jgi:hypothetical protein
VTDLPQTRYVKTSDGLQIGYQVLGDGQLDLLYFVGLGSHVDLQWDSAALARCFYSSGLFQSDPSAEKHAVSTEVRAPLPTNRYRVIEPLVGARGEPGVERSVWRPPEAHEG